MANLLNVSIDECKEILNNFYEMFPTIKEFTLSNEKSAKDVGFVEDYIGRRRHLPDANLDELEIVAKRPVMTNIGVFMDYSANKYKDNMSMIEIVDEEKTAEYKKMWEDMKSSPHRGISNFDLKTNFKDIAKRNHVSTFDNGAFISKTLTQCTNARIQGSAATLTKKAMVNIFNDPIINELGFRILIPVHDEILGECPIENVEKVEKRLVELMINAAKPECSVDMKVDTYAVKHWYADEVSNYIHDKYINMIDHGVDSTIAKNSIIEMYNELNKDVVESMCLGTYDLVNDDV